MKYPLAAAEGCLGAALDASAPPELRFYRDALARLNAARAPYLVGGAYAYAVYTGIQRHTKDLDIFVRPADCEQVLALLAAAGYRTEVTFTHWLGKAFSGDHLIDVIFSSGNGLCPVDDGWFEHATHTDLLGVPVLLTAPEEMIWSKAFIMERERFDGADVGHVLRSCAPRLDWERLLARFGTHWQVLLSHLLLLQYAYPADAALIPRSVLTLLLDRAARAGDPGANPAAANGAAGAGAQPGGRVCRGTCISREYMHDVRHDGYRDARIRPLGNMSADEVARWMAAFEADD